MEAPELAGPVLRAPIERLTPVSENLLLLRYVDHYARMKRLIAIMKVRDSRFDPNLREFEIEEGGVVIGPGFQGERGVLTGEPTPVAVHDAAGERDRSPRASPEGA
jgi:circadian clock protein KaiC